MLILMVAAIGILLFALLFMRTLIGVVAPAHSVALFDRGVAYAASALWKLLVLGLGFSIIVLIGAVYFGWNV